MVIAVQSALSGLVSLTGAVSPLDGLILAYVGPEQFLPLTSFFGAVIGILLMFWNRVIGAVRKVRGLIGGQRKLTQTSATVTDK